jgi:hypothetical protein
VHLVRARQLTDPLLEGADPPHRPQKVVVTHRSAVTARPVVCFAATDLAGAAPNRLPGQ